MPTEAARPNNAVLGWGSKLQVDCRTGGLEPISWCPKKLVANPSDLCKISGCLPHLAFRSSHGRTESLEYNAFFRLRPMDRTNGLPPSGRLMRRPSEVGCRVKPWPMVASGGSCSVVCSVRPMSCSSGSSHCAGLGITMPTFGKLPK